MIFRALVTDRDGQGKVRSQVRELDEAALPDGNVLINVDWAGFNYKDGLVLTGQGRLVRDYPHIGGIDFAGRVVESTDARYHPGQAVISTGWRVGELHWGGFARRARVDADWLVPLPKKLSARDAMVLGTAGLTAMLAINRLKSEGVTPKDGDILVTGAGGGVGSIAVMLLARLGYSVVAVTGRKALADPLKHLGARDVIGRESFADSAKKLEATRWAAAIDVVGGPMLGAVLKQINYGGMVVTVGLAGGDEWEGSVVPFILRGISLIGIDSVMQSYDARVAAWERLAGLFVPGAFESMVAEAQLEQLPGLAEQILNGQIRGKVVVKP